MAKIPATLGNAAIPTFVLYEDGQAEPAADFVHVETIKARAGLHDWEIHPHRHASLHQYLIVLAGGTRLDAEGRSATASAPALFVVPAGLVHGFAFTPDAEGFVLTVAERFLEQCLARGFEPLAYPTQVTVSSPQGADDLPLLRSAFEFLDQELAWQRPGRSRATAACLDLVLVAVARRLAHEERGRATPARRLVAHFKTLVNSHAPEGWSLARYAGALGVTVEQLTRACKAASGRPPMRIVHDRLMAEAKRSLIYTSMSIQEVGFALGFEDPAYFTRFFARREGRSPSRYRLEIAERP